MCTLVPKEALDLKQKSSLVRFLCEVLVRARFGGCPELIFFAILLMSCAIVLNGIEYEWMS